MALKRFDEMKMKVSISEQGRANTYQTKQQARRLHEGRKRTSCSRNGFS